MSPEIAIVAHLERELIDAKAEIERMRADANAKALAWTKYTDSIEEEIERLRVVILMVEWSATAPASADVSESPMCPVCLELKPGPHAADCELATALGLNEQSTRESK